MAKAKSTTKRAPGKPGKPRPNLPLFPHATRSWAKKVRDQTRCFGEINGGPEGVAALGKWLDQKDDLLAGRAPRGGAGGPTVHDLCNRFVTNCKGKMKSRGEVSARVETSPGRRCATVTVPPTGRPTSYGKAPARSV
jgi:hypothetical protein